MHQFRGKSFVHRDMNTGAILSDPLLKREIGMKRIEVIRGPKKEF